MHGDNTPAESPRRRMKEYEQLNQFTNEIEVILQTVYDNEYQAATYHMKPPPGDFTKPVIFPWKGMVVGMFADKKTALIQTRPMESVGSYVDAFPNAKYVIGVGVCFAFDVKYELGDVLVSEGICNLSDMKDDSDGEIKDCGDIQPINDVLKKIFCTTVEHDTEVKASDTRNSKVHKGILISQPYLIQHLKDRDRLYHTVPTAIGGEMEGGMVMKFKSEPDMKVVIIKGVADYGDGNETKEWQFTAAMASLQYAESKLRQTEIGECKVFLKKSILLKAIRLYY